MKKIGLFIVLATAFFSCRLDETPDVVPVEVEGEWILTQTQSPRTGKIEDTDRQEMYVFNQDGTFIKTRTGPDQANGTFTMSDADPNSGNYQFILQLTYQTGLQLLGGCNGGDNTEDNTEELRIMNDGTMIRIYSYCDGLDLIYQKK